MKKYIIFSLLLIAIPVSAQNNGLGIDGKGIQEKAQELKGTFQEGVEQYQKRVQLHQDEVGEKLQKKEVRRVKLQERRAERVGGAIDKIGDRFDLITERLEDILSRFESRLDKFEELNIDVSEPRNSLEDVEGEIQVLKEIISKSKINLEELLEGEVSVEEIRAEVETVRDSIKEVRGSITDVLNEFKASIKTDTIDDEKE